MNDEPVNRFEQSERAPALAKSKNLSSGTSAGRSPPPSPQLPQSSLQVSSAPPQGAGLVERSIPDSSVVAKAVQLAGQAESLEELKQAIAGFDGCNLKFTARSTVFADGTPGTPLMLIGEAPGRDEDEQGLPFVGRSGQLLDRMLAAINLDRNQVYISNILPWRPPGNRTPTPAETEICRPFIERHIELAQPQLLMLVGGSAAKTLLSTKSGIMSLRGKWQTVTIADREIPAMPCLHPAYLLRTPNHKGLAWKDLLAIKQRLIQLQPSPQATSKT